MKTYPTNQSSNTRTLDDVVVVAGDRATGRAAAERILARMREPIQVSNEIADVCTSIGGIWTGEKGDVSQLLKQADALLYDAKAAGKDAVRFSRYPG